MTVFEKGTITVLACSLLFAAIALPLLLERVPRNVVYGYRTRATLASDRLWYAANACFGRWLLAASLTSAAVTGWVAGSGLVAPESFLFFSVLALGLPVVVAGVRTGWLVRRLERDEP